MKTLLIAPLFFYFVPMFSAQKCETTAAASAMVGNNITATTTAAPNVDVDSCSKRNSIPPVSPHSTAPKHDRTARSGYLFM